MRALSVAFLSALRSAARSFWQRWGWLWAHDPADANRKKDSDDIW